MQISEEINSNNYNEIRKAGKEKWEKLPETEKKVYKIKAKESHELYKIRKKEFEKLGYCANNKSLKEYKEYIKTLKTIKSPLDFRKKSTPNMRRGFNIDITKIFSNDIENDKPFDQLNLSDVNKNNDDVEPDEENENEKNIKKRKNLIKEKEEIKKEGNEIKNAEEDKEVSADEKEKKIVLSHYWNYIINSLIN